LSQRIRYFFSTLGGPQGHCMFGRWPFELGFSECLGYVEAVEAGEIT
jgi:hypothetical protein